MHIFHSLKFLLDAYRNIFHRHPAKFCPPTNKFFSAVETSSPAKGIFMQFVCINIHFCQNYEFLRFLAIPP